MMATQAVSTATDGLTPAPPADLVERFAAALKRLNPQAGMIGLAVSGGPDSMAMLLLADAAISGQFEVATVNHGLRAEAGDECALVQRACDERGIACAVLQVEVGEGNVQAEARAARYGAIGLWAKQRAIAAITTAHHADDQAETLLMRLNRGSGVAGLAGVREASLLAESPEIPVLRPLLTFRRAELASVVAGAGLQVADDPSNRDEAYDRVRIRGALASADWIDPLALAKSAANLADAEEALHEFANFMWSRHVKAEDGVHRILHGAALPRAISLKLVEWLITAIGKQPRGSDVARLIDRLAAGENGSLGGVLVTVEGHHWIFRPEPPRNTD